MIRNALAALAACAVAGASVPGAGDVESIADSFRRLRDAVVVVHTLQRSVAPSGSSTFVSVDGVGSGVLLDEQQLVLTAAHVVQAADRIEVEFAGGERIPARVRSAALMADVALLEMERLPANPVAAHLGDSDQVQVGDEIFVVGAPLGISHSLTVGHVSGRRRASMLFGGLMDAELLQTDAAVNTGNSGGPMFTRGGQVVGVVSSILSRSGGFEGIGFAVTSNTARRLLTTPIPWTGFEGVPVSGPLASLLNLPQESGLLVQRVADGSPAARAGLRPGTHRAVIEGESLLLGGDIILAVDEIRLSEEGARERILERLVALAPGGRLRITILRAGRLVDLEFVAPRP